jgi:hypothetical protein
MLSTVGNPKEIVNGYCPYGIDHVAVDMAKKHKWDIKYFPADRKKFGKSAGPIRNKQMAEEADALLLIWTGDEETSPGSANMKKEMLFKNKPVYEVILRTYNVEKQQDSRWSTKDFPS